jgi:tetratricopeptide (TPR) repeat protein
LIRIQPVDEGVDALLLAADCYAEINNKNKIAATSEQLLQSLKLAFNQEKKIQEITEKMTTIWREKTDLKSWLEDQALNHPKESVRRSIVKGMATVELPHLDNANISVKNLGDFFVQQNRFEEAIHAYLQLSSTDLFASLGIIRSYLALKKYEEAIAICQQYYKPGANDLFIFALELISIYREAGKYNEAISIYSKEIETNKDQFKRKLLFLEISFVYHEMGQYSIAMEHCEQAIDINSLPWLDTSSHNHFACLVQDMGQYEEAETVFSKAISVYSKNKICYNNIGYLYRVLERWDDAVCYLHMAMDLDSTYALPHVNIGLLYLLVGDLNHAESAFETAIQINPFQGSAFLGIGMLDAMRGNMANAKMSWQSGLERYGEHSQRHRLFRTLYTVALGHVDKGLATLECLLNEEKPPRGLLRCVRESAKILHSCPGPIAGIENVINLLEMGINKAPVFKLRSKQKN